MTDQPPTGDRPEPEDVPPAPTPPEAAPPAPPTTEPSIPEWTSAEAAPAPVPTPAPEAAAVAATGPEPAAPAPAQEPAPMAAPAAAVAASAPVAAAVDQPPAAWQAPPTAPPKTPEVPGAPGRYFAATVTRVAALLIDTILLGILAAIVGGILSAFLPGTFGGVGGFAGTLDAQTTAGFVVVGLGGLVVSFLYFYLSWRSAGKATPGQRVFKMQVGNAFDGAALTAQQITIRWLTLFGLGILAVLPFLAGLGGFLAFIWDIVLLVTTATSLTKQGIHDRWAGSAVVATGPQNTGLAWGCLIAWVVGIFILIAIAAAALVAIFAAFYSLQ